MSLLPQHSHCLNCDDPVEEGQQYCSEKCRLEAESQAKKDRNKNLLFIAFAAAALIVIGLMMALG